MKKDLIKHCSEKSKLLLELFPQNKLCVLLQKSMLVRNLFVQLRDLSAARGVR